MKKLTRVCFVLPSHWSRTMGGAEYQVKLLITAMIEQGDFEIHYLCRNAANNAETVGYQLHTLPSNGRLDKYAKFFDSRKLLGKLREIKPDVIYQRNGGAYTGICAYYARRHEIKMVWHIAHEKDVTPTPFRSHQNPFQIVDKLLLEYGIRHATAIIAQTQNQDALLKKYYQLSATAIIRNFHPKPSIKSKTADDMFQVLWVANFNPNKRPHLYLELAKQLEKEDGICFTMVGRSTPAYEKLTSELAKQENLVYLGSQTIDVVNDLFEASNVFVSTSSQEGFPNTFIQAWLRGVPVLSLCVDPDDILRDEGIGVLSVSLEKMAHELLRLKRDSSQVKEMGIRARRYANENFSLSNINEIASYLHK